MKITNAPKCEAKHFQRAGNFTFFTRIALPSPATAPVHRPLPLNPNQHNQLHITVAPYVLQMRQSRNSTPPPLAPSLLPHRISCSNTLANLPVLPLIAKSPLPPS